MSKKCPICGKNYRDYIKHIWSAHKKKTIEYLAKKRKAKGSKRSSKRSPSSRKRRETGLIREIEDVLEKYR